MSFLNPVNEPVLRFSSTDASAPQINYNARTAGDVKAVLKACLVTGYGAKASAGWTAVNETATVIEFVSPSAAMSDYRLGIDDTSAASTTWYYRYQDVRVNPGYNGPAKSIDYINKTSAENGWLVLATARGLVFIEFFKATMVSGNTISSRITYLSTIKSARNTTTGSEVAFFNIGHGATINNPVYIYRANYIHINIGGYGTTPLLFSALPYDSNTSNTAFGVSSISLSSSFYICNSNHDCVLGELPGLLARIDNDKNNLYVTKEEAVNGRACVQFTAGYNSPNDDATNYARNYLFYIDYWGY